MKCLFKEQAKNPLNGDFYNLVKNDLINEETIINTTKSAFKSQIKKKTRIAAFVYLQAKQNIHSKVMNIKYTV